MYLKTLSNNYWIFHVALWIGDILNFIYFSLKTWNLCTSLAIVSKWIKYFFGIHLGKQNKNLTAVTPVTRFCVSDSGMWTAQPEVWGGWWSRLLDIPRMLQILWPEKSLVNFFPKKQNQKPPAWAISTYPVWFLKHLTSTSQARHREYKELVQNRKAEHWQKRSQNKALERGFGIWGAMK